MDAHDSGAMPNRLEGEGCVISPTEARTALVLFIRAIPRLLETMPEATIAFVGQGSAWAALRMLAAEVAPDAIRFVDPVPPAVAATWLRSARARAS